MVISLAESLDHKRKTNYCIRLWLLQELADCTFLEARIYLRNERNETLEKIASLNHMNINEIQLIEQSANEKVHRAKSKGDLFHGFEPIYPKDGEIIEW